MCNRDFNPSGKVLKKVSLVISHLFKKGNKGDFKTQNPSQSPFMKGRGNDFNHFSHQPATTPQYMQRLRSLVLRRVFSYSHSMVEGGLEVISKTTRFTSGTSLTMRLEMRERTS